jgi:uncharacterized protein YutE (UPF0331/DUF86 family)
VTDPELIAKRLAAIETAVAQLRALALLGRHGWLASELATGLENMAGFRNILVHGYADVDLEIVRDVVEHRLVDLLGFFDAVRRRLP